MKDYLLNFWDWFEDFVLDMEEWRIFFKRWIALTVAVIVIGALGTIFWFTAGSVAVAPFYASTTGKLNDIKVYPLEGKTTVMAIQDSIDKLLDEGLVTNFIGVRNIIDNRENEQIGQIDMLRIGLISLENHMARNRGTGGANKNIRQARAEIHADYELPWFTSYTTRLKLTKEQLNQYLIQLEKDKNVPMKEKQAVFIVNSDNLAETLDKLKQELQTTLSIKADSFFNEDDKYYRVRGNLIALQKILKGVDTDFKNKMIDKTSYNENFVPLLQYIEEAINETPFVLIPITEKLGHLSKIEKYSNEITQKLAELRNKLRNG